MLKGLLLKRLFQTYPIKEHHRLYYLNLLVEAYHIYRLFVVHLPILIKLINMHLISRLHQPYLYMMLSQNQVVYLLHTNLE